MPQLLVELADEAATARLGNDLARAAAKGDLFLLSGDLGAGKTTLARSLIRTLAGDPELDVPSPTFTLAQSYDLALPVAHFDLYRLTHFEELDELGLDEALETGIALVEWPERADGAFAHGAVTIELKASGAGRTATISADSRAADGLLARIGRSLDLRAFLAGAGLGAAMRRPFAGDASPRIYELAADNAGKDLVIMDQREAPAGPPVWKGKPYREIAHTTVPTVHPFVAIGTALIDKGFAAPAIHARDLQHNFLALEHLGLEPITGDGQPMGERYAAAASLLADIHGAGIPATLHGGGVDWKLPVYDRDALMIEALLALDWYFPSRRGREATAAERQEFTGAWDSLFSQLDQGRYGLVLRDYHSPNLIWRAGETGRRQIGVLDFQDGLWGPNAYDLASLAQDARIDVTPALEAELFEAYLTRRRTLETLDEQWLRREFSIMALQRNTKILGIFVRLDRRDGKPGYLKHLPRIEGYVRRTLRQSGLARLAGFYADMGLLNPA